MLQKMTGNEFHTTVICMDDYGAERCRGRLCNPFLGGAVQFGSLMQMLLKMETLLDEMHFPQSFTAKREFTPAERTPVVGADTGGETGRMATFAVRVLFRQNASWQGSVTWLEENREESFRSTLELLMLMHSALNERQSA